MSCSAPAAEEGLGYVYLGPAGMADWADEARGVVKALHRLALCRAESPHITTATKVMWTRVVEFLSHRVRGVGGWGSVSIGVATDIPFRRRGHDLGSWPFAICPSCRLGINNRVSESGMAVSGDLYHDRALPAEVDLGDFHLFPFGIQEVGADAYLPHGNAS